MDISTNSAQLASTPPSQKEYDDQTLCSGLEGPDQQEGVEDARGVATAPAGHPDSTGVVNTTSGADITLDGEDDVNTLINLDKTYQKNSNANKTKKQNRKSKKKQ